jgi:hypothetical protein
MLVKFVSLNKFIIKIDSMIYLMILFMYYKYIFSFFLQTLFSYIYLIKVC